MKKKISSLVIAFVIIAGFGLLLAPHVTFAQTGETINDYNVALTVNHDGTVHVTETILYNPAGEAHHGIYRDIRLLSAYGYAIDLHNVMAHNEKGIPYPFTITSYGQSERIKIGDPDVTFITPHIYVIDYYVVGALGSLKSVDELYWNVTGNGWGFPILHASASVTMPNGANITSSSCYEGYSGSNEACGGSSATSKYPSSASYETARGLNAGEGMTIAVDFPKGSITIPPPVTSPYGTLGVTLAGIALVLPSILAMLWVHRIKKSTPGCYKKSIVAQYDPPQDLTPLEMKTLIEPYTASSAIAAEIIYLASKGYFSITRVLKKNLVFSSVDYEFRQLKAVGDKGAPDISDADQLLVGGIFSADGGTLVNLSSLKGKFYSTVYESGKSVETILVDKGYLTKNSPMVSIYNVFFAIVVFIIAFYVAGVATVASVSFGVYGIVAAAFLWGLLPACLLFGIGSARIIPFTEKGAACRDLILGFKEYLQIAEKDRINFANAPEKNPTTFTAFLPYAMALGVEKAWSKEFADITLTSPDWYHDTTNTSSMFNSMSFINSMSSFRSAMQTSSSASGGGGGGFSGGGGGGGGGGSW